MLTASVLVLLMTVPGLALFYGGLVRTKNMLSMLMQVFARVCLVCIIWVIYGYSLAFTEGGALNAFVGGFSKAFLPASRRIDRRETFSDGVVIPEYVYICFQMTFACITPALIVGVDGRAHEVLGHGAVHPAVGDVRLLPDRAHGLVLGRPGCDRRRRQGRGRRHRRCQGAGAGRTGRGDANAGLAFQWGALDFAGGTVVHINAGIAGLVGALMVGKRVGFGREAMPPHSLTMTMIGAALLWVGWFGFNAGSALEANGTRGLAMINTFVATAAAALAWMLAEMVAKGKPQPARRRLRRGRRPRRGHAGLRLRRADGRDRARPRRRLRVLRSSARRSRTRWATTTASTCSACTASAASSAPSAPGILAAPISAAPACSTTRSRQESRDYDMVAQVIAQAKAVGLTLVWSGVGSADPVHAGRDRSSVCVRRGPIRSARVSTSSITASAPTTTDPVTACGTRSRSAGHRLLLPRSTRTSPGTCSLDARRTRSGRFLLPLKLR